MSTTRSTLQQPLPPMGLDRVQTTSDTGLKSLQRWKDLFSRACQRAGLSGKQAASHLGISESQLSSALAYDGTTEHRDHLSFWRMRDLPKEFWEEMLLMLCEYHGIALGQTAREREDGELGRSFRELAIKAVGR
jgi:hypothetical protein